MKVLAWCIDLNGIEIEISSNVPPNPWYYVSTPFKLMYHGIKNNEIFRMDTQMVQKIRPYQTNTSYKVISSYHGIRENITWHFKSHICRFLECKEDWLELVFGGNFCQLHKFMPTTPFSKVQVHSTRLKIELALKTERHMWMRRVDKYYVS